jgi:very-short-patch-repair endonuclease
MEQKHTVKTTINAILCAMEKGEWKNWYSEVVSRGPSFEEAFFTYLFDMEGFIVEREYVVGHYPIDFAIPEVNLAIEIDSPCCRGRGGKRSKKNRALSKDKYLNELGWTVCRVHWVRRPFAENIKMTRSIIKKTLRLMQDMGCPTKNGK